MKARARRLQLDLDPETGTPIFPTREVWATLGARARADVLETVREALVAISDSSPGESTLHSKPGREAVIHLEHHFRRIRRGLFIAQGLPVCYPGEATFSPDVIAVLDAPVVERVAWMVDAEGRGIDFALEILVFGDRKKDLVTNVARFARLGIPEYFVFDVQRGCVLGYRLAAPGADRYVPIVPQYGRLPCETLGLELAIIEGRLRFFMGAAALQGPLEEVELLSSMVEARERALSEQAERANAAELRAESEADRADAAAARADAEAERADTEAERARTEAERARAEAERTTRAVAGLRAALYALCAARGLEFNPTQRAHLDACDDVAVLTTYVRRATSADMADALFDP
jgi:hypothetical protein